MTYRIGSLAKATAGLAIFAVTLLGMDTLAAAQHEEVLHSFNHDGIDGMNPQAGLIIPYGNGVLYGTTSIGGAHHFGAVFEVDAKSGAEKVLTNVVTNEPEGGLTCCGADGSLFGTTFDGGNSGGGKVFEIAPTQAGGGGRVLYSFESNGKDGRHPFAGLLLGHSTGNHLVLYGTTVDGGNGGGAVFEVLRKNGSWEEKVLHSFPASPTDGEDPYAGVIIDAAGNLYGTTQQGGAYGYGTVFELIPTSGGAWAEKLLHSFKDDGTDGENPFAGLVLDAAGNLYGTTAGGGTYNNSGTVFELTPAGDGSWTETVLHDFNNNGMDGFSPEASLTFDRAGNLYGTTQHGGAYDEGTVFELTPTNGGSWTETVLHSFAGSPDDGANPMAGLVFDASGILYGTTNSGGTYTSGTVFEIEP
jgi:uncharacterized repeat protein (TIGR03803 family)